MYVHRYVVYAYSIRLEIEYELNPKYAKLRIFSFENDHVDQSFSWFEVYIIRFTATILNSQLQFEIHFDKGKTV